MAKLPTFLQTAPPLGHPEGASDDAPARTNSINGSTEVPPCIASMIRNRGGTPEITASRTRERN